MKFLPSARHRGTIVSIIALAAIIGTLTVFAIVYPGVAVRKVALNDSGIWVTRNEPTAYFGRYNKSALTLDAAVAADQSSGTVDIRQDRSTVLLRDGASVIPIDVRRAAKTTQTLQAPDFQPIELGGGSLARFDPATGKVWATRYEDDGNPASTGELEATAKPRGDVGASPVSEASQTPATLAVSPSGIVYALSAAGRLLTLAPAGAAFAPPAYADTGIAGNAVQLTTVGDTPVAFDPLTGRLWLGGESGSLEAPDPTARLQAASVGRPDVIVATQSALLAVSLKGGPARTLMQVSKPGAPAAPVQVGACIFAAWAGPAAVIAQSCGGAPAAPVPSLDATPLTRPVFRVNRGQAILNDVNGLLVDMSAATKINNWDQVTKLPDEDKTTHTKKQNDAALRKKKPTARNDDAGARPGRTTILHVLDNDTDPAGRILTAKPLTQPTGGASVEAAPDGQTLLYKMPPDGGNDTFTYQIDNGDGGTATAEVAVKARSEDENAQPKRLERDNAKTVDWTVVAGGSLTIPALADWRDYDGDPLSYQDARADQGDVVTAADRLEFTAPDKPGQVKINYWVTDGRVARPGVPGSVTVTVLGPDSSLHAAIAQPDVIPGVVDEPIVFQPLANDVPGADAGDPDAALAIAGALSSQSGLDVQTDLKTGKVTATASRPGTFNLTYQASYGAADLSDAGHIRLLVKARPANAESPIGVPDEALTHGQQPVIVDVLANDVDPAGSVLTVEAASSDDAAAAQVSVLRGRWLRIVPLGTFSGGSQVLHYRVTNGVSKPATVQVTLTQLPAIDTDPPITRDDTAVVRAGDTVTIPVLQNDSTAGGALLSLATNIAGVSDVLGGTGRLQVTDLTAGKHPDGLIGAAYATTNVVRYVAPAAITQAKTVSIDYVAQTDLGLTTGGTAVVTVLPATPDGNRPPAPAPVEARVTAGGTIKIPVPSTGQDPDGDAESVTGISATADSLKLGRVVGFSPTSITYQAYPTAAGTDSFSFTVTDRYGATGTAVARVAVTQPKDAVDPVAVPDTVTAVPGATVKVSLLANDLYDRDDAITVLPLAGANSTVPKGMSLDEPSGTLQATAPTGDSQVVSYAIRGAAGTVSKAAVTIRSQADFNNPPVAYDQVAKPADGGSAEAEVMASAWDPDGPSSELTLSLVDPGTTAQVVGTKIVATVAENAQVIPYQITDGKGGVATAVVHVPGTPARPYLKDNQTIQVGVDASTRIALADYIASPRNQPIALTTSDRRWASPSAGLSVKAVDPATLQITATDGYTGPGAITLEVTDSPNISDSSGKAIITIPVQVGPAVPVLRCPSGTIDLIQGGKPLDLTIASLCHVWAADPDQVPSLAYTARLDSGSGVTIAGSGSPVVTVSADSAAKAGDARLQLTVAGAPQAKAAILHFRIVSAPKATLLPIRLDGIKQGSAATIDLTAHLASPLREPEVTVLSVEPFGKAVGSGVKIAGSTITITPPADSSGLLTYGLTVSDVADPARKDRQVVGSISLQVYGIPEVPQQIRATAKGQSHTATVSWRAGGDNGAPITQYRVTTNDGKTQTCAASPCQFRNLKNAVWYTFTVEARNKAGWSPVSQPSNRAQPDAVPPAVVGLKADKPADGTLVLSWTQPDVDGTPVKAYRISWPGHVLKPGPNTTFKATGLDNHVIYTFSVVPINNAGAGKPSQTKGQSSGRPKLSDNVQANGETQPAGATTAVTVTWVAADPNGPDPAHYTVTRSGPGGTKTICSDIAATRCVDGSVTYDGETYTYHVTATNKTGGPAHTSAPRSGSFVAVGKPDSWSSWSAEATGTEGQVKLDYRVPPSRGKTTRVVLVDGGSDGQTLSTSGSDTVNLSNGDAHTLTLKVCNEERCTATDDSHTVTPYGPFRDLSISGSVSGPNVNFTVSGNANGLDADIYVNGNHVDTWHGGGSYSGSASPGYDTDYTVDVRTSDGKRPDQHASKTFHTDKRPLSVSVGRGSVSTACNAPCYRVAVSGSGFPGSSVTVDYYTDCEGYGASCSASDYPKFGPTQRFGVDGNGNFSADGPQYFGFHGAHVWVIAHASDGRSIESEHITWPS